MKFHNDFIGLDEKDKVFSFLPGDTEETFNRHYLRKGQSWYYRNVEISYIINENGHRSKSINDLDLNNYILFTGCSHTMGIGLELEKTYPHLVSHSLGFDYYNIALPGTGIDAVEYNLLTWLHKVPVRPKIVFIQMPDHTRFMSYKPFVNADHLIETGTWAEDQQTKEMIVNAEDIGFLNARKYFIYQNIIHLMKDTYVIKYNVAGQANQELGIKMRRYDYARDMSHFGIKSHAVFAEDLVKVAVELYPELKTV